MEAKNVETSDVIEMEAKNVEKSDVKEMEVKNVEASDVIDVKISISKKQNTKEGELLDHPFQYILFILNMVKNIMGSFMLILPWTFARCGLVLGFFITIIVCLLSIYSFCLIAYCSEKTNSKSYSEIFQRTFGYYFGVAVDVMIVLLNFGSDVSYLIVALGSLTKAIFILFNYSINPILFIFILSVILFGICYFKRLIGIRYISFFVNMLLWFVIISVVVLFANSSSGVHESVSFFQTANPLNTFVAIPIASGVFDCHTNAAEYYYEFKSKSSDKNIKRFYVVVAITMSIVFVLSVTFALVGYLHFGKGVSPNVIENYGESAIVLTMNIFVSIAVLVTFSLFFNSLRLSAHIIIFKTEQMNKIQRIIETSIIILAIAVVATFTRGNLGEFVGCLWSLFGSMLVYVLPGIAALKVKASEKIYMKALNWILILFGSIICSLGGFITSVMLWVGYLKY